MCIVHNVILTSFLFHMQDMPLPLMSVCTLAIIVLAVMTTAVNGAEVTDCECQYNLWKNRFYATQQCFNSYYELKENVLGRGGYNDTTIDKLISTFCGGTCGTARTNLLNYEYQVYFHDTRVSQITM